MEKESLGQAVKAQNGALTRLSRLDDKMEELAQKLNRIACVVGVNFPDPRSGEATDQGAMLNTIEAIDYGITVMSDICEQINERLH